MDPNTFVAQAIDKIAAGLEERGMNPDTAREYAEHARSRLVVSADGQTLQVRYRHGPGFYPASSNPLRQLVNDVWQAAPLAERSPAEVARQEQLQRDLARSNAQHAETQRRAMYSI